MNNPCPSDPKLSSNRPATARPARSPRSREQKLKEIQANAKAATGRQAQAVERRAALRAEQLAKIAKVEVDRELMRERRIKAEKASARDEQARLWLGLSTVIRGVRQMAEVLGLHHTEKQEQDTRMQTVVRLQRQLRSSARYMRYKRRETQQAVEVCLRGRSTVERLSLGV